MNVISLEFGVLVLAVFAAYYTLPHQNPILLTASFIFLGLWAWEFALVTLLLTVFNFYFAKRLGHDKPASRLWLGVAVNIAALVFFKYNDFFINNFFGLNSDGLKLLLPIGISFYTLQHIAYLFDVQRGTTTPSENLLHFALYTTYFPKLIAGPIERSREFLPQLTTPKIVDNAVLTRSFGLIAVGVVRKVLIADVLLTLIPDGAFREPQDYAAPLLLNWLLAYSFALYNDFAGYTSVVRGVSGLFGIELTNNFNFPYFASSLTEFWNRWHISLSHWLRDYIYLPLTRALIRRGYKRDATVSLILPPMATMLISGLWHGVGWHMLLWGALHGFYQVVEKFITRKRSTISLQNVPGWRKGLSAVLVFGLVVLAWIPFRMELPQATEFIASLVSNLRFQMPNPIPLVIVVFAVGLDWVQYRKHDELVFLRWNEWIQAGLLACILLAVFLVTQVDSTEPFIYQGF